MDYLDQLTPKELAWFNKFMDEYNGAKLDYKNLKKNLHKTKQLKKDCTDKNNARNRCVYAKMIKFYVNHWNARSDEPISSNPEDAMIELIDSNKKKRKNKRNL